METPSLTEKEKMIMGMAYRPSDKQLSADRLKARELIFEFNRLPPKGFKQRKSIIKQLFAHTENMFYVEAPFNCDYGYNISIGQNFYANFNLTILDCAPVNIGDNVFIGPNVSLFTAGHPMHPHLRNQHIEWAKPITIGNNVWICGNVCINPGVTIGAGSVIGTGSVVTKDIPENVFAAGNPCQIIRTITDEEKDFFYKKHTIPSF
ncbi:sugar O-acetyltransferase [Pedobacter sp.]|uniref:sugar O-acetyltransferase n=1 Tax=Pedobacter sp. TaxID=1411316 RepID=UPI00396CAF62